VAEEVQRTLDGDRIRRDAEELDRGREFAVERAGAVEVAVPVSLHHLLDPRADDVRVHADAAAAPDLEEGEHEVVIAGVQVEVEVDDPAGLVEIGVRLLDRPHGRDLRELCDGVGLEVERDPARDVVDDDRTIAHGGDRLEVLDDPAHRWLVVVGGYDQEPVDSELVCTRRQVKRMRGRVRARARNHGCTVTHLLHCSLVQREALLVGERRRLPGRPGDYEAVGAVVDEM
jgi:hypothetical protein